MSMTMQPISIGGHVGAEQSVTARVTARPRSRFRSSRRAAGLSIVELLMALAITAMLLTATMAAVSASFRAYADASQQASAQAGSRLVMHRLIMLVRTSTAHGPLAADNTVTPAATVAGNVITSPYIELLDAQGNIVRMEHRPLVQQLWLIRTPAGGGTATSQPVLGGVSAATFTLVRRRDDNGLWILQRGTVDLTIQPASDTTLALERGRPTPIRMVASTMPRKVD
jgi:hypothetical protein